MPPPASRSVLRRFLEANWLKPYDAVWDAAVASRLASIPLEEPSLDLGCGDGLFMLIACGGRARLVYDRYTDAAVGVRGDRYNQKASMASTASERPARSLMVGLDAKAGLLDKARRTGTYRHLVRGDGQSLPFRDGAFASLFCNILYWLPDWQLGLREMRRVLSARGRLVLVVPNEGVGEALRSYHRTQRARQVDQTLRARWFDWIDNGRFKTLTRLTGNLAAWRGRLADADLTVQAASPALDVTTLTRWDYSTRPILPCLMVVARCLRFLGLKTLVKRLVVPILEWQVRPWLARSLAPTAARAALWVLVAEPTATRTNDLVSPCT